jgi:hypothetical protein
MRKRARVDGNHAELVQALRQAGCTVQSLAAIGNGAPDLLVGVGGRNLLVEVKNGAKPPSHRRLTPDEATWHQQWRGQVVVVATVDEALAVVIAGKVSEK